jgi:YbgC/YbaW family acyl-CoA thioester hydrolase
MGFATTVEVRFGDCDPAGIVYYPVLYHYCHIAFEEAWRGALGISYPELVADRRLGFPTVHVETDFVSPARYGDTILVEVAVLEVGTTSVVFRFEGRVGERVVLRSTHTTVCLDLDAFAKQPIPDTIREALVQLVPPA